MVVQVGLFSGHFGRFNILITTLHEHHGRSRKELCFQRQVVVSWCTCDPLVVIASDIQVRIAGESFSYRLLQNNCIYHLQQFFQRRSINLLLYFSKGVLTL